MRSAAQGDVKQLEQVLEDSIFDQYVLGRALMLAVQSHRPEHERRLHRIAQLLIAKGAEVDYSERDGCTALMVACKKVFETVADELIQAGADIEAVDANNRTVWDYLKSAKGDVSMLLWALNKADRERKEQLRPATVQNLRAFQKDGVIVVRYDLVSSGPVPIMLMGSDDNGRTYALEVKSVKGHVGEGVSPGEDREIIWALAEDFSSHRPKSITLDVKVLSN